VNDEATHLAPLPFPTLIVTYCAAAARRNRRIGPNAASAESVAERCRACRPCSAPPARSCRGHARRRPSCRPRPPGDGSSISTGRLRRSSPRSSHRPGRIEVASVGRGDDPRSGGQRCIGSAQNLWSMRLRPPHRCRTPGRTARLGIPEDSGPTPYMARGAPNRTSLESAKALARPKGSRSANRLPGKPRHRRRGRR